ncbi:MAG: apolipoprotein N-acyltransferase [Betaproteobacteria bacterium]|nr:apolipoprotein N-acyltransferase [Betaproteobacteria bacterium]
MTSAIERGVRVLAAAGLGAGSVFGFAPFHLSALPILALALLFVLWRQAASPRAAALLGFAFGLGFFLAGTSWVYISLHTFGGMPAELTAIATLGFCAVVACYPALAGWLTLRVLRRVGGPAAEAHLPLLALAIMPACWTVGELLRGTLLGGFPWLGLGYSQVPGSPLAGYAALLGSYGVTWMAALCSGALALVLLRLPAPSLRPVVLPAAMLVIVVAGGALLRTAVWTEPTGAPLQVALLQGNVAQERKFDSETLPGIFELYRKMVERSDATLIILPETAFPVFLHQVDRAYLDLLARRAVDNRGDLLFGVAVADPSARAYFNSVVSIGGSPPQAYRKQHLVPFGEYLPLRPVFGWVLDVLHMPMADFSPGPAAPAPLAVAGQRLAMSICYEDAFGGEMRGQLPEATLLVNVSNDAWFGESFAAEQHWQIAQMRALESGRMMLRANNTGITGIIGIDGRSQSRLAPFTTDSLRGVVQGRTGATPYVRWGEWGVLLLLILVLAGAAGAIRRGPAGT